MFAGNETDFELPAHFRLRRAHEKNGIEQNVSSDDDERSGQERARNIALGIFYFTDDVTRSVPARVGIHHVDKRDGERAAEDLHRIGRARQKADLLLLCDKESCADERCDQKQLHNRPNVLERAAESKISEMENGCDPNEHKGKHDRRTETEDTVEIFSERHGCERDRRGEANSCGNKSGHEADRGMINLEKKMIFAAGAWKRGAEFAVAKRAAKRGDAADNP